MKLDTTEKDAVKAERIEGVSGYWVPVESSRLPGSKWGNKLASRRSRRSQEKQMILDLWLEMEGGEE